jgi:UPF0271 protein
MKTIDINCDMGESYGRWILGDDKGLMPYVTSVNVAAGYHGGDPATIRKAIEYAVEYGLQVGAHVAFPDLMGFGRRRMIIPKNDLRDYVTYQIGAVQAFALRCGIRLGHVKPHGALYVMASEDAEVAAAVAESMASLDKNMCLMLLDKTQESVVKQFGIELYAEGFPDIKYDAHGKLMVEPIKEFWEPELVASRALQMVMDGSVTKENGEDLKIDVSTICIHGDAPNAVDIAKAVRAKLESEGVDVKPLKGVQLAL